MNHSGINTRDPRPGVKAAGKVDLTSDEGTDKCVQQDIFYQAPGTPDKIKKYRKSYNAEPGARVVHYGLAEDVKRVNPNQMYGKKTYGSDHVNQVIRPNNETGLADYFNERKESKYASNQREPLGKSMSRKYEFPGQVTSSNFAFGVANVESESAKEVLFPQGGALREDEDKKKMYVKTHGAWEAGEQKDRGYEWGLDKTQHRFGKSDRVVEGGAAAALQHEAGGSYYPKTRIVKKTVEDFRNVSTEALGKSRHLGQDGAGGDKVFGIQTAKNDAWDAGKCITGEANERELQPDSDLGKARKRVLVKDSVPGAETRVFGVPSIRDDVPKKKRQSVADFNNYGDEPRSNELLFPQNYTDIGVDEGDFYTPWPRAEIKAMFENIGHSYKMGKFNAMFNRATQIAECEEGYASVRSFMQAIAELDHIE
mmetsp:Transcript_33680/g.38289  ORF Transcript_33680/g.38289 Transcript_33680/m.38289 type:complete len:425 (-) Transcript_33680:161-1435(-)